ncbi:PEP_CTERM-anchored TLD domain-containing protein [Pseudoduganella sp. RAF53_2]|uniref:PEP_CTERM-anchored TLD domain-containing protein n=1 Tax=unclassified Pseudoduganella TaxID=2637179 RepID=UPI003F9CD1F4
MAQHTTRLAGAALAAFLLFSSASVHAFTPLLSDADKAQLARWLGKGPIELERVYKKREGQTAADFHAAADGKGATFTVMEATNELGQSWLVGGYNPQSWSSTDGFHITADQSQRTGFIFNLTSREFHRQTPKTYALDTVGSFQTFNDAKSGPVFGAGHDLYVPWDLTNGGYSIMYSYIDPERSNFNSSLLDGRDYVKPNITFGDMEVFTVSLVPEPAAWMMLLPGLALFGVIRKRNALTAA